MRQDILLSFLLHFLVIISLVIATPFKPHIRTDLGEVITVSLAAMPAQLQPRAPEPVAIPKAVVEDEPIAFVPEAKSIDKAKPVEKPKPKEKKKKDDTYRPEDKLAKNPKPIGYSYVYLIQRLQEKGSAEEKDEKLLRLHFDLEDKLIRIDRVGF